MTPPPEEMISRREDAIGAGAAFAAPSAAGSRRVRALARRWGGRAFLATPAIAILLADLSCRHARLANMTRHETAIYVVSVIGSGVLWGSLLALATRIQGTTRWLARIALIVLGILAIGGQAYMFDRYQAYLNHRAVLVGTSMLPSVGQQIWMDRIGFARAILPPLMAAIVFPILGIRLAPLRKKWTPFALDAAIVTFLLCLFVCPKSGSEQGAMPDVLYLSAIGQLSRAQWDHNEIVERVHPGPRTPKPVPGVVPTPPSPRNVLFVLTESVRASSTCVAYDPNCKWTPFSNEAAPNRIPIRQMRALDSTTAISLSIVWGGLAAAEPREASHSAPLAWEYAQAAGIEPSYWTSQNLLFGNSGTWLAGIPFAHHVNATELDPDCPLETGADDDVLVSRVIGDLDSLHEPFFGVVHLSNTHYPYKVDPAYSPFVPEDDETGPATQNKLKNRYQDAIYLQDHALGRLIHEVRARDLGKRTVIVFLSDHGEQMREHGAVGHTGTLFEEEIRIPAWIDAPEGTLSPQERANLRSVENTPETSVDVLPTMLDLMGIWDAPAIAPFRAAMLGESMLRGGRDPSKPIVMTNCSELWACAFKNWGAIAGTKKLIGNQGDHAWNCFDVASDPDEMHDLGPEACGGLRELAEANGRGRPF